MKPGTTVWLQVPFLCFPGTQRLHFFVGADSEKAAVSDGDCFGARLTIIDGDDVFVVKNQLRLDAI